MTTTCSWCHTSNDGSARHCWKCGHRADVPRSACDCPKCWKPVDGVPEPGTPESEPTRDQIAKDYATALSIVAELRRARDELFSAANDLLREADTFHDDTAHYIEVRRAAVEALREAVARDEARFWKRA